MIFSQMECRFFLVRVMKSFLKFIKSFFKKLKEFCPTLQELFKKARNRIQKSFDFSENRSWRILKTLWWIRQKIKENFNGLQQPMAGVTGDDKTPATETSYRSDDWKAVAGVAVYSLNMTFCLDMSAKIYSIDISLKKNYYFVCFLRKTIYLCDHWIKNVRNEYY